MNNNFENTEVVEIKQIHRQIEKRKRKKPKFKKFLWLMFIIIIISSLFLFFKAQTIIVQDNKNISNQEVQDATHIFANQPMILQFNAMANWWVSDSDIIKSVKIKKNYLKKETKILVTEYQYLGLYNNGDEKLLILKNGELQPISDDRYYNTLEINSELTGEQLSQLIEQLKLIDENVMNYISEVEYVGEEVDSVYLLYMTDGNKVYINLNEMAKKINLYPQLKNSTMDQTGIFYLNVGNYFKSN